MVMVYGIGGIGIMTMPSNGLLMKAVLEARTDLAHGRITDKEWHRKLQTSQFDIPHWGHSNPFKRNYAQFIDSVGRPQIFAKHLPLKPSVVPLPGVWPSMKKALRFIRSYQ